jgi:predicted acetyltransferase
VKPKRGGVGFVAIQMRRDGLIRKLIVESGKVRNLGPQVCIDC